jgi:hypothetical protein
VCDALVCSQHESQDGDLCRNRGPSLKAQLEAQARFAFQGFFVVSEGVGRGSLNNHVTRNT